MQAGRVEADGGGHPGIECGPEGQVTAQAETDHVDLVEVSPYPPLSLAFRARLVDLDDADTIWMADEIFDARDPATARGARQEARAHASGVGDPTSAVQQSPVRFADHAFRTVASLLPPRILAEKTDH